MIRGRQRSQVVADLVPVQLGLARPHPVDVAEHRVDLAVVGDHPQRLGELPAGRRVGREAGVDDREDADELGVAKVGIEARQLGRGQEALVDHRARGEAGEGDRAVEFHLRDAADHVEAVLEGVLVGDIGTGRDQQLADARARRPRQHAGDLGLDRHLAPSQRSLALLGHDLVDPGGGLVRGVAVTGQEGHRDAGHPRFGELLGRDPELLGARAQEVVGEADHDSGAVAAVLVRARCSAVLEPVEGGQAALDDLVDRRRVEPSDAGDAAARARILGPHQPAGGELAAWAVTGVWCRRWGHSVSEIRVFPAPSSGPARRSSGGGRPPERCCI